MKKQKDRCRAVKESGEQCTRKPRKGSQYCSQHTPGYSGSGRTLPIIGVALAIVALVVSIFFYLKSEEHAAQQRYLDQSRRIPRIHSFPVQIDDGTNIQLIDRPGTHKPGTWQACGPQFELTVTPSRDLLLNMTIRDSSGRAVAELLDSHLNNLLGRGYDVNQDESGFEFVDDNRLPILQVQVSHDPERISLRYVTYVTMEGWKVPAALASTDSGTVVLTEPQITQFRKKMKRMFRYPGLDYPGVRQGS